MRKLQSALLTIALFFFILPFQNCSLSQSQGRKFLLSISPEELVLPESSSDSSTLGRLSQESCQPFISKVQAQDVLKNEVELKLYYNPETNQTSCVVSQPTPFDSPLNTLVCTISNKNLNIIEYFDQFLAFNDGKALVLEDQKTSFIHYPSMSLNVLRKFESSDILAIRCAYEFSNIDDLDSLRWEATELAKQTAEAIAKRQIGN